MQSPLPAATPVHLTVPQFSERHRAYSEGGLRWLIHRRRHELETAGALVRLGRRVLVDESAFFQWVSAQQARRIGAGP